MARFSVLIITAFGCVAAAQDRHRLVVLTDFFKDPDDKQSLIRLLSCANEFEIEGLIATSLAYGDGSVHAEWIKDVIDDYGEVLPRLRQHERHGFEYPTAEALKRVVRAGAPVIRKWIGPSKGFAVPYPAGTRDTRTSDPPEKWVGPGKDTAASEHIISVVDRDEPRPVWVAVWGGAMDLAQALWKVRNGRTPAESARFVRKLRVYQISWQDTGAVWIWDNFPELFLIQSSGVHRGMYAEGPASMRDGPWVLENVSQGHGRLGAGYPKANTDGIKEGDTPSFLHLLAAGLSDPEHPEWGGWGGRFERLDRQRRFYVSARDAHPESDDEAREVQWTLGRWNEAISNDFAARMDWCVRAYDDANHHPVVQVDGDTTRKVLHRNVVAGQLVSLDASGTDDPDGDTIGFRWWQYIEAGSFPEPVTIQQADGKEASFIAPEVSHPQTLHIVLAATDDGQPPLTSYRRVIFTLQPRFSHRIIDGRANRPVKPYIKLMGDLNGDGFTDLLAASAKGAGIVWYAYPDWAPHIIRDKGTFSEEGQLSDLDADGDLDIVIPSSSGVLWFENRDARWIEHPIGSELLPPGKRCVWASTTGKAWRLATSMATAGEISL